jgi:aspartate carbamoyltransferase catalytic subunit
VLDDVLYTGRTIRAVLNELFDYGRPPACAWPCWWTAAGASCPCRPTLPPPAWRCRPASRWRWRATTQGTSSSKSRRPDRAAQAQPPTQQANGELIHLLSIEGLPRDIVTHILDTAANFVSVNDREVKKVPLLRGKSVFNLFFENSTRTRTTFEIAAKRLSADVINLDIARSSASKGESAARHHRQPVGHGGRHVRGAAQRIGCALPDRPARGAACARGQRRRRPPCPPHAGAAGHVHHPPLQEGLQQPHRGHRGRRAALARGALGHPCPDHAGLPEVRVVGPRTLVPGDMAQMGVRVCHTLEEGIKDADVVIMLRLQNERMSGALLPSQPGVLQELRPHAREAALAKPDAIVMHPGPINRGVEIDSAVVDGKQSVILPQVTFGIAVRMAVMSIVAGNEA